MNTTRQLSERITERIEDIPNGFRAIDKDALLSDIRDLYDAVQNLEPSGENSLPQQVEGEAAPEPSPAPEPEPVAEVEPAPEPEPTSEPEPVAEVEQSVQEPTPAHTEAVVPEADPDEGTLAGKLNQKPISDLRSGIPLNEKFGFIQNLFQNNASDYGDAILKMNNATESDEALLHFETIASRKGWDAENPQVRTLRTYVERRHILASEANADQ